MLDGCPPHVPRRGQEAQDMTSRRHASPFLLLAALAACAAPAADDPPESLPSAVTTIEVAPPGIADERDAKVLEALLLALLKDPDFDLARSTTDPEMIVLDEHVPSKTGFIGRAQVQAEAGKQREIPDELIEGLLQRNQQPGTYDTLPASFAGLAFDRRIVVANLDAIRQQSRRSDKAFEDAYPQASAWVSAW